MPVAWRNWGRTVVETYRRSASNERVKDSKVVGGDNRNIVSDLEEKNLFGDAASLELSGMYYADKKDLNAAFLEENKAATRTLKVGSRGDDVKRLQENLNELGYNSGKPDGIFGNGTKNAVVAFQKAKGLSADGIVGPNTQNAINKAISERHNAGNGTLKVGSRGTSVTSLQKNLNTLGYNVGTPDGIFGNNTKNAVMKFQRTYGITADGIVGKTTQDAINMTVTRKNKGVLSRGQISNDVRTVQSNLKKIGLLSDNADGVFGKNTENAVIQFQKKYGLTADGLVGTKTKNKLEQVAKNHSASQTNPGASYVPKTGDKNVDAILDKLNKNLNVESDKKVAMLTAGKELLQKGYDMRFVAGVLGNIQNEGTPGKFESSAYLKKPSNEPSYLVYMDDNFSYRTKYSGKTISEVGVSSAVSLANDAKNSGYKGKFGLGMIQWTGNRTNNLMDYYRKMASSNNPDKNECAKIEASFIVHELETDYKYVYDSWKSGAATAESAGDIVCRKYEVPRDTDNEAVLRSGNARNIYAIMTS